MINQDWPSPADVVDAYRRCRLKKAFSFHQAQFESKLGQNLLDLHHEISTRTYKPTRSIYFVVERPKPREIFASHFRDRIVHHLIVRKLEPWWERRFIHSNFACRKGRGTHAALRSFLSQINRTSRGNQFPVWVLKLDIEAFFPTISRSALAALLLRNIRHPALRYLVETTYSHDSRKSYRRVIGPGGSNAEVDPQKSWFARPPEQGIPIGNLTSQFGANVYLNGMDHFIQRELKPMAYQRYMDDLTLFSNDPESLAAMIEPIDEWLKTHRGQRLNRAKTFLGDAAKGVDYLGYKIVGRIGQLPEIHMPPKKKWEFVAAVRKIEQRGSLVPRKLHALALRRSDDEAKRALASLNSRIGHLKHAKSYRLRKETLIRLEERTSLKTISLEPLHSFEWKLYSFGRRFQKIRLR